MPVEPIAGLANQLAVEPPLAATRLVTGNRKHGATDGIEREGDPPLPACRAEPQAPPQLSEGVFRAHNIRPMDTPAQIIAMNDGMNGKQLGYENLVAREQLDFRSIPADFRMLFAVCRDFMFEST